MTTPDPVAPATVVAGHRLHPMSWLFELIAQLRQFLVPLLALVVFGQGDRSELWPLAGVAVLVAASLWRYFAFRYQPEADQLVLRTGLLSRNVRVVPYGRIHNVAVDQTLLHRLFDVASVRLESAGGKKPEAEMRVLRLDQALALEDLIRHRGATAPASGTGEPSVADAAANRDHPEGAAASRTVLHHLPAGELLRLGIISNRGMVLVAAAFALVGQSGENAARIFEALGRWLFGWVDTSGFDTAQWVVAGTTLLLAALLGVRLLSVVLALLQFHGFTLAEYGRRLTVERGLLARWRTSTPRRRIQAWRMQEGVIHRLLDRRTLKVDIATGGGQEDARSLRELVPVGTPEQCRALVAHLLPGSGWDRLEWMPFRPATWWRLFWPSLPLVAVATAVLCWRFGAPGLLAALWLPWAAFKARRQAARMGWAFNGRLAAFRTGWWSRHWYWAELDKLQALRVSRNPVDRRLGTATLVLDTAGAGALGPPLRIPFLPLRRALALQHLLAGELARRPLRW